MSFEVVPFPAEWEQFTYCGDLCEITSDPVCTDFPLDGDGGPGDCVRIADGPVGVSGQCLIWNGSTWIIEQCFGPTGITGPVNPVVTDCGLVGDGSTANPLELEVVSAFPGVSGPAGGISGPTEGLLRNHFFSADPCTTEVSNFRVQVPLGHGIVMGDSSNFLQNDGRSIACTISGGEGNRIEPDLENSTIGGGGDNIISENFATIAGGDSNTASGYGSVVCGGIRNISGASGSFIGAGENNSATGSHSGIVCGRGNTVESDSDFIGGGTGNTCEADNSGIVSGTGNRTSSNNSFIGSGDRNVNSGEQGFIGGGTTNNNLSENAVIGGGLNNRILAGVRNTIAGGLANTISDGNNNTIGGGESNTMPGNENNRVIGGGRSNQCDYQASTICGGIDNHCTGGGSVPFGNTICGGTVNTISANAGGNSILGATDCTISGLAGLNVICGGEMNTISGGTASFACGNLADNSGFAHVFIWGDGPGSIVSTGPNQVIFNAQGGGPPTTTPPLGVGSGFVIKTGVALAPPLTTGVDTVLRGSTGPAATWAYQVNDPANWGGIGNPITVREAIRRIAVVVAGAHGAIP